VIAHVLADQRLDDVDVLGDPRQRLGHLARVLAPGFIPVSHDHDLGPCQEVAVDGLPLAGAAAVAGGDDPDLRQGVNVFFALALLHGL